jgi:hypothetical protein
MAFEDAHMLFASAVLAAQPAFVDVECAPDLLGDTVQYVWFSTLPVTAYRVFIADFAYPFSAIMTQAPEDLDPYAIRPAVRSRPRVVAVEKTVVVVVVAPAPEPMWMMAEMCWTSEVNMPLDADSLDQETAACDSGAHLVAWDSLSATSCSSDSHDDVEDDEFLWHATPHSASSSVTAVDVIAAVENTEYEKLSTCVSESAVSGSYGSHPRSFILVSGVRLGSTSKEAWKKMYGSTDGRILHQEQVNKSSMRTTVLAQLKALKVLVHEQFVFVRGRG